MSLYATGGPVQQIGSKRVHFFTTVGPSSLIVTGSGNAEVLIVAGGGAGGSDRGGGGGAGGYIYNSAYALTAGTVSVTVGAGGVGTTSGTSGGTGTIGGNGGSSIFAALTAVGGGGGGGCNGNTAIRNGANGGSGGGGSQFNGAGPGGTPTAGQGSAGGTGNEANNSAGGGGGATSVGANAAANGGNGGAGINYSISGTSQTYCSGGGGGKYTGNAAGYAGTGGTGAGNGSDVNNTNGNAASYYGCGGGGAGLAQSAVTTGGNGYQGIVIVSYDSSGYPIGPNGEAVYFSTTSTTQATLTVASLVALPGAVFTVVAKNPNGVSSNPVTFTVTNTLDVPAFLNPGPKTFVGGGSFFVPQTSLSTGITWSRAPTTGVTLTSPSDSGVTVTVSDGIPIASPTNYTLTATDTSAQATSQTFTIQNTFIAPAFVNPGTQSFTNGGSFSVTQTAANTGQLGWSINPTTGMTLSGASTGGVTVTVSAAPAISGVTYTLTATNPTPTSCVQSFSVTNTSTALYSFTTFTFTPIGATGPNGPTSLAGYGGTYPGVGTSYALALSAGVQYWTVPSTGNYTFTLAGAGSFHSGGQNSVKTGYGMVMNVASYSLTVGQLIAILVGQISASTSGGGGTFIASVPNVGNLPAATALFVAGGAAGPGGQSASYSNDNINATLSTTGRDGVPGAPNAAGAGGVGPAGATRPTNFGYSWADQGAGFTGNGQWSERTGSSANVAKSFQNGGTGSLNSNNNTPGGFGGGGAGGSYQQGEGGGGGGYGGGGSGGSDGAGCGGGGGGSYNITGTYSGTATNSATGYVTITKL